MRISPCYAKKKTVFSPRGYEPQTELEYAQIEDILFTSPLSYKLKDKKRSFYSEELVAVTPPKTEKEKIYFIEKTRVVNSKILRSGERVGGQTQYLLKAKNAPDQSSWISEGEYRKLKEDGLIHVGWICGSDFYIFDGKVQQYWRETYSALLAEIA